jgi:23S rRNA pseudouridine2605 synthase
MARPHKPPQTTALKRRPIASTEMSADADTNGSQRLHKLLALAGFGSRRDMEKLIESGRVSVNGHIATVGAAVIASDTIKIDNRVVHLPFEAELPQVLLYHKPEGEIVSADDPEGRASVFDKLPRIKQGKWIAIGRLDINTSGLLIFTNSGELANRFMHPRYEVEREYAVRILGELSDEQLLQLTQGIELEDGMASFNSIYLTGGEGANKWYQVVIKEGRNREVRRLFEAFHLPVSRLMRVRFGPINLPPRVKRGTMLKLEPKQVIDILEWAGMEAPKAPPRQLNQREKDKATSVFTAKVRKQRGSILDKAPRETDVSERNQTGRPGDRSGTGPQGIKKSSPKKPVNRRIRGDSMSAPDKQKTSMQHKSDRNRGRG